MWQRVGARVRSHRSAETVEVSVVTVDVLGDRERLLASLRGADEVDEFRCVVDLESEVLMECEFVVQAHQIIATRFVELAVGGLVRECVDGSC